MHLDRLELFDFRNYQRLSVRFSPHINFFIGKNGHGKSNLLEAVSLLFLAKSFRTPYLKELIRRDQEKFILKAQFYKYEIEQRIHLEYGSEQKLIRHNETVYKSFLPLVGILQGVLFTGYGNKLIKGGPQDRRLFLDLQNAPVDPLYIHHLHRYQFSLKQRNYLLKKGSSKEIEVFEEIMALTAPYIVAGRRKAVQELEETTNEIHEKVIGERKNILLRYKSHEGLRHHAPEEYLALYRRTRFKDAVLGYTSIGPHRDDLTIFLENADAKKYASEGEIQSMMSALYLSEYLRLRRKTGTEGLLCIDDLVQSLDPHRLQKLLSLLEGFGQVFITVPDLPSFSFRKPVKIFQVEKGTVVG